jgi:hypothetical protein
MTTWTFDEFYASQKQVNAMIDTVEGDVDIIFVASAEQKIPAYGLSHMRKLVALRHGRHRYTVVVGAWSFLISLLKVITEFVPDFKPQLYYAPSLAEAYRLISEMRELQNPV